MMAPTTRSQEQQGEAVEVDESNSSNRTDLSDPSMVTGQQAVASGGTSDADKMIEALKLQIELERLRQQNGSMDSGNRPNLKGWADSLRAVLAPMPESDELVPAWFRSAENMIRTWDIPNEAAGSIIVPFLNERSRALIANKSDGRRLLFEEVRDVILEELKMTPEEYKRRLYGCKKGNETWGQFVTKLEGLLDYYLRSRNVRSLEELRSLLVADRVKQLMNDELRSFILQHETKDWLKPKEVASLAEKFEDSRPKHRLVNQRSGDSNGAREGSQREFADKNKRGELRNPPKCFSCGRIGHMQWSCPQERRGEPPPERPNKPPSSKLTARAHCDPGGVLECGVSKGVQVSKLTWIELTSGKTPFRALLDSGAEITVVRRDLIPDAVSEKGSGKLTMRGAFGHAVEADLMYVPLSLSTGEGSVNPQLVTLCAVTNELAEGVDAILTPDLYDELRQAKKEADDLAARIVQAEKDMAQRESVGHVEITLEPEERERNEESGEIAQVTAVDTLPRENESEVRRAFVIEQRDDSSLSQTWEQARTGTHGMVIEDGLLFHLEAIDGRRCKQLVLPESRRKEVLVLAHDRPCGGHFSQKKTKQRIRSAFFWPNLAGDVKKYCQSCHSCQMFSNRRITDRVPITPLTRPQEPFEVVYLDCIGPIEPTSARGHRYALCLIDLCTRWPEVIPLRSLTAQATCQALLEVFPRFGTPQLICCDQGTNFTATLTRELAERLGIRMRFSTPEHPQSNGIVERWNGTFKTMLRHVMLERGREWDRLIPCMLWAYREVPHEITGTSPFEMMYGRVPQGPLSILQRTWSGEWSPPVGLNKVATEYLVGLRQQMSEAARAVDERIEGVQRAYAEKYNLRARSKEFSEEEQVLVLDANPQNKMHPKWIGPVKIKERKRPDSYVVQFEDGTERWVHANRLRKYYVRTNNVGVIFEEDAEFGEVESTPCSGKSTSKILEVLREANHLTSEQAEELGRVIMRYEEAFSEKPGRCALGEHKIRIVPGGVPGKAYPYRVPVALRPEVDRQIDELREWDLVYPVASSCAHPIVCVAKKDGSVRLCIDYRQLNAVSEVDNFPMGNVTELLFEVARARYVTILDMTRGYWQIPVEESSQRYTAFATPKGLFAWKVMPYGLRNSAATFQRVMNETLQEHRGYACAYIDDVAVYSETWQEHLEHIDAVLATIAGVGFTVNPAKCKFAESKVRYLGHVVGSGIHSPDPERVEAILQLKAPVTKKDLRSALGLLNYYRDYIPSYSEMVLPLTDLTNRRVPNAIPWNEEAESAFNAVKHALSSLPTLTVPEVGKEFILTTDASEMALGACLAQETDGEERPIAFLSKKLTPQQAKWSAIEREAFAVVWALGRLDTWLFGAKVKVVTDHNPLTYLTRSTSSSARLTRWSLALQKYDLQFSHIKGSLNKCADALSRLESYN